MKKFFKIAGIGCLGFIGLFIISAVFVGLFGSDKENNSTDENVVTKKVDSVKLKEDLRIKDSISIVRLKKRTKAEKALKTFRKIEDEFEGNTFYYDKRTPKYTNRNFIYPYIGKNGDHYWLRLRLQYASENWLFIKKGTLLIDGEKYTITGNWEKDHNSGIWEWLDIEVKANQLRILNKIANSKSTKVRYEGTKYHDDRTITSKEKSIIRKTLEIYDSLK